MAFEGLAEKLQNVFDKLTRRGEAFKADIKAAMREVKLALLEADVNFLVVKEICEKRLGKGCGQRGFRELDARAAGD